MHNMGVNLSYFIRYLIGLLIIFYPWKIILLKSKYHSHNLETLDYSGFSTVLAAKSHRLALTFKILGAKSSYSDHLSLIYNITSHNHLFIRSQTISLLYSSKQDEIRQTHIIHCRHLIIPHPHVPKLTSQ